MTQAGPPTHRLLRPVVLIGMMGAGKSAVGAALAELLGVGLVDSDREIEAAANMTIAEIFAEYGEPFFRQKEGQVLERILDGAPAVISTGGGAWLSPENRTKITARGTAVWLDVPLALLWSRVRHKTTRPLLNTADPKATLAEIYAARTPIYALAPVHARASANFAIQDTAIHVLETLAAQAQPVVERLAP